MLTSQLSLDSLPKQQPSSQTDLFLALHKFGDEYLDFLKRYPTLQKRESLCMSLRESVEANGPSMSEINKSYGCGAGEWWCKYMLIEMFTFLGAMDVISEFQVCATAEKICTSYFYLSADELSYFFYQFSLGTYGKLYVGRTINPQDVFLGLKQYAIDVTDMRSRIFKEQKNAEMEKELCNPDLMSYDEWCIIHQMELEYEMKIN